MADFVSQSPAVEAANVRTKNYVSKIDPRRGDTVKETNIDTNLLPGFISKHVGKVRDVYRCENYIVMVATDRQSAFDRQLTSVPFKGQVLNLTSLWWFNQTKHIVPNHVLASPHPNITIGKKCTVFPVEFVMRGYITGSTSTSMWTNYAKGMRNYCGHILPEGLKKNQKLDEIKLTPTTKDDVHDELISAEEVVKSGRMTKEDWDLCAKYSHELFAFGQKKALERGLILVDTKYEFGKDEEGNIMLIDEIQTPDSSRFWIADTYDARFAAGEVSRFSVHPSAPYCYITAAYPCSILCCGLCLWYFI
jgi:phosphoribosylaminoimidazole-succinocarboxamide synthase